MYEVAQYDAIGSSTSKNRIAITGYSEGPGLSFRVGGDTGFERSFTVGPMGSIFRFVRIVCCSINQLPVRSVFAIATCQLHQLLTTAPSASLTGRLRRDLQRPRRPTVGEWMPRRWSTSSLEFRSYKKDRSTPPIDRQQEPTAPTSLTNWYDVVWNRSREEESYEKQMAGCQPSLYCFPAERGAAQRPSLVCRRIRQQETHQGHR